MDTATKNYIDSLDRRSIPWNRMFTAYGTAEHYNELLSVPMFPPAPFALVFLVRILQKLLQDASAYGIVKKLIDQFMYYAEVCCEAEEMEHAQPLSHFGDLLDDGNLLPEDCTEEDLDEIFENPDAVSDELFFSFYYYAKIVLSQVPDILDQCGMFPEESKELRYKMKGA